MSRTRGQRSRRGFSLVEMTIVMVLLGAVLALSATIFHGGFRLERAGAEAMRRLLQRHELADQFRADVAAATAVPDTWEIFEACPTCLILKKADGQHLVYEWRTNRLTRFEEDGDRQRARVLPVDGAPLEVEFIRAGRLITLRLEETGKHRRRNAREIAAALPGGVR